MNWVLQNDRIGIKKRFFFYYSDMPESCGKTVKQESEQTSICDRRDVFFFTWYVQDWNIHQQVFLPGPIPRIVSILQPHLQVVGTSFSLHFQFFISYMEKAMQFSLWFV